LNERRARVVLLLLAAAGLVAAIAGGLARLGVGAALPSAAFHGAVMVCGFLGTVISLERAVALRAGWAYLAPAAAGLGTVALLLGGYSVAAALWLMAPIALLVASAAIVRRQRAAHTVLLAVAAVAWLAGSLAHAFGRHDAAPAWWFAFLVLTIGAERLEMTRLMRRRPLATPLLAGIVTALLLACAVAMIDAAIGRALYGLSLAALAAWLAAFDIARRTVRTEGFARYSAFALLCGYAWLAVAGFAWAFASAGRDVALHALGLGFVFSMILGHAPLIVPVVAGVRMRYMSAFYLPLALLHASLVLRLLAGHSAMDLRVWGALGNTVAIGLFMATLAFSIATRERRVSCPNRGRAPKP